VEKYRNPRVTEGESICITVGHPIINREGLGSYLPV